jgi:aminoglycoside/choline kinase family phosphotransferase
VTPVPEGPDDVTPAWLTAVLREAGHLPRGAVTAVSVETIGADRGFTGVVARLRPRYEGVADPPPPASLVAKLPTAQRDTPSAYRRAAPARAYYERCAREVSFYRDLAGDIAAVPQLYHGAADPEQRRVVLLLADLAGGQAGDALAGCTPAQAGAILDAVAPLHARMWQRDPPAWVPALVTDPAAAQQRYATRVDPFLERYGHQVPPPVRELVEWLAGGYAAVLTELMAAPATVVHTDLHLDNVVFGTADQPVALLDWQSACRGPAVVDLVEVVFGSLPVADRRAAESELLARYAARLAESGVADYPVARLRQDCRAALLRHLAGRVGWLATADPDGLSGRERALVAAVLGDGRLVAALLDHVEDPRGLVG